MWIGIIKRIGVLREVDGVPHLHRWFFEGPGEYIGNPTYDNILDKLRTVSGWDEAGFNKMNPADKKYECDFCGGA